MKTRRDFIKTTALGAGALSLTPCMNALAAAGGKPNGFPKRFIFIRKSNGEIPTTLALPTFSAEEKRKDDKKEAFEVDLDKHELPQWMNELARHKNEMAILQGISAKMTETGHYSYSSIMGAYKSNRNSLSGIKRATIDFELAKLFPSPFGHVELSITGDYSNVRRGIVSGYSASAAHQRNYCYADPQTALDELFRCVTNPSSVESENAMLHFLENEENFKASILQGYEKLKLSNHISSIESIQSRNMKLTQMGDSISKHIPKLAEVHANGGIAATTLEKQDAMTEVLVAALITGLTNVVTYTIDDLGVPVSGLPGNEGDRINIHTVGHNGSFSGVSADMIREKIRISQMKQMSKIVDRLKAEPEGNGSMFDNTMIMHFPEGGEGHHGHGFECPYIILAGKNCNIDIAGRYVRLPYHATEGHKTLGNWYTTLLNAHGNAIKHYGDLDLDMSRLKYDQLGAIRQFMA